MLEVETDELSGGVRMRGRLRNDDPINGITNEKMASRQRLLPAGGTPADEQWQLRQSLRWGCPSRRTSPRKTRGSDDNGEVSGQASVGNVVASELEEHHNVHAHVEEAFFDLPPLPLVVIYTGFVFSNTFDCVALHPVGEELGVDWEGKNQRVNADQTMETEPIKMKMYIHVLKFSSV